MMGVDMTFLPFWSVGESCDFSLDVLDLERRRELWPAIETIEKRHGRDVPPKFSAYMGCDAGGERIWGLCLETAYGWPLQWVYARELVLLRDHPGVIDNYKNRAAWAYLAECPDNLKIALYWH